jgi:hypothetical protein
MDIPSNAEANPYPVGPDPKTWNCSWETVTDPKKLALHVCAANNRQYHQAHSSPFCSSPLLDYFGYRADMQGADNMVSGHSPPEDIMQDLPLETQNICSTLASVSQQRSEAHPNDITVEAFKSLYTALDERTLSSPSGRHLGHYKAATQSEKLSTLHSQLMLIPSITGISPTMASNGGHNACEKAQGSQN